MILKQTNIGVIGAGSMAKALLKGLVCNKGLQPNQLYASHYKKNKAEAFENDLGIRTLLDNKELVQRVDVVILAVKPQILPSVLDEIASVVKKTHLLVSVAAGIQTADIRKKIPSCKLIRAMPNLPALVGEGMTALCAPNDTPEETMAVAEDIFKSVGQTVVLEEDQMDAVTGLSGSGPAFTFLIIEALADAGVKVGLSRETSLLLASQTVLGSSKLLIETKEHPGKLKDQVTSPGGTAIAGLHTLEQGGLRNTLINAVESATHRARELGRKYSSPA